MKASSELARTSRAAAPIAAPNAAKPTPPATIADGSAGKRPHWMSTKSDRPPSIRQGHGEREDHPEPDLLAEQSRFASPVPARGADRRSPPTPAPASRRPGGRSRTSASRSRRRRSRTSRGSAASLRPPPFVRRSGARSEASSGVARSRFWRARRAKRITRARSAEDGLSSAGSERIARESALCVLQPEDVEGLAEQVKVPPAARRVR